MADIRIKDLTTTASSSASDDFIAVDGTTNGTRKLNAFSPTFGGNATVTGTLTVNGYHFVSGSLSSFSSTAGVYKYYSSGVGVLASYSDGSGTRAQTQISGSIVSLNTAAGNALTVSAAGVVAIPASTASTTTSSGALVVGNGTSGGLGVGGAANIGGTLTVNGNAGIGVAAGADIGLRVQPTLTTATNQYGVYAYPSVNAATVDGGFFGVAAAASASVGSAFTLRAYSPTLNAGSTITTIFGLKVENHGAAGVANAYGVDISAQSGASSTNVGLRNAGTTLLTNTTVSNNTSSGALVVSGGVGVAKSVTVGESIDIGTGHGTKLYVNNSGAWSNKELLVTGYADLADFTQLKVPGNASNTASLKLDQTGLVTISGAVRTAAPAGGTAAAWKLGTVASVSPTSPNRTIEVDIGGTIYYIHAKTTNN